MLDLLDEFASLTPGWDEIAWSASILERVHAHAREASRDPIRKRATKAAWLARNREKVRAYYAERYQRQKAARGGDRRRGKLSAVQVEEIRALAWTVSAREAGRRYGVRHETIIKIWRGEAWAVRS